MLVGNFNLAKVGEAQIGNNEVCIYLANDMNLRTNSNVEWSSETKKAVPIDRDSL